MSTVWQRKRAQAYNDGQMHADGGDSLRHKYKDDTALLARYDQGYEEHGEYLAREAAYREHPLRVISRKAEAAGSAGGESEVRELADLIRDMAEYLLNKESNS